MSHEVAIKAKQQLIREVKALEIEAAKKLQLPHIYGFKPYAWTREYWDSTNRMKFICAGNQVSKSSTQIRHAIDLATDKSKWNKFFPKRSPKVFWYIYPNKDKVKEEFEEKWIKEFLPRGAMIDDPEFGWTAMFARGNLTGVKFHSGVTLYFKTWHTDLQSGTVDGLFIDEELPKELYPELAMRVTRYDGIISMVFTATLNQKFWFDVIERRGQKGERFPDADKWQISMEHHCRYYADGTESPWTPQEVQKQKNKCGTITEINRRIHGRFVSEQGVAYPSFSRSKHLVPPTATPGDWEYYAGVDIGAGGPDNHPACVAVIAVRPDYRFGKVTRFWLGNNEETTDTSQILNKYIFLTKQLNMTGANYDWASKEFALRAQAAGVPFAKAEKARDFGEDLLNILLKNNMLVFENAPEYAEDIDRLATQFETLRKSTPKTHADDDGIDGVRYGVTRIPWDLDAITSEVIGPVEQVQAIKSSDDERIEHAIRQSNARDEDQEEDCSFDNEIDEYNELMEY